jgi:hypothetical protein
LANRIVTVNKPIRKWVLFTKLHKPVMAAIICFSYLCFPILAVKSVKFINNTIYKNHMEDHFDAIPVQYRTERLGRMRDLIMQIEADYKRYNFLKQMVDAGIGDNSDMEELYRRKAWMKRSMTTFIRLNAMSIEGITFVRIGEFSSPSYLNK